MSLIECLIEKKIYGVAIDLTKYEVVRIFGGIVFDLNYNITTENNLSHILDSFSFFSTYTWSSYTILVENSMIAASQDHPILVETCNTIKNRLADPDLEGKGNYGLTEIMFLIYSQAILNNLDPYKKNAPEELLNLMAERESPFIGRDGLAGSWHDRYK